MLADGAQHDDAHARIVVERLEDETKLIALSHFDDVERRPVEDNVGAFARRHRSRRESRRGSADADRKMSLMRPFL